MSRGDILLSCRVWERWGSKGKLPIMLVSLNSIKLIKYDKKSVKGIEIDGEQENLNKSEM